MCSIVYKLSHQCMYVCILSYCVSIGDLLTFQTLDLIERGSYQIKRSSGCPSQQSKDDITRDVFQLLSREFGVRPYGRVRAYPATSCEAVHTAHPDLGAGLYWVSEEGATPAQKYCPL